MRDEGDRFDAWRLEDAPTPPEADQAAEWVERALLAYAHRSAARVGAEWFAAEFARREEDERLLLQRTDEHLEIQDAVAPPPAVEVTLVDASVEDAVVGGAPTGLGLAPKPQPELEAIGPEPTPEPVTPKIEPTPQPVALETEPTPQPVEVVPEPALQPAAFAAEPISEPGPLGVEPATQPAIRHPHVPRPPAPEPAIESKRRRRNRTPAQAPAPTFVISAPEWARMSPGARRLYGIDAAPPAAATG